MKQKTNIAVLTLVLSIPFALSQTRKPIPVGRYEALSGYKVAHNAKGADVILGKDSLSLFFGEVTKHLPTGRNENFYYSSGDFDVHFKALLNSKGAKESKGFDGRVNILLSDNLDRDSNIMKKIKTKGSLIILKDQKSLKEVLSILNWYDVLLFQAENSSNYFLLKLK